MTNIEKWNLIVDKHFQLKHAQESAIQNDWEMYCAELFGYKRLFHEIDAQRRLTVGSGGAIIPDIILRVDNNDIFDIELKQYSLPFHETFEKQLISYLNQTHLSVGMIVCNKIYLYHYEYDAISIRKIEIPFEKDNPDGIALMEFLTKETFSKDKIKDYISDKLNRQKRLEKIKNTITREWLQKTIKSKLLAEYSEDEVNEVLNTLSFNITTQYPKLINSIQPISIPTKTQVTPSSPTHNNTNIESYIYEWCIQKQLNGEITNFSKPSSKKYFRFTIPQLDNIFPEQNEAKSGWGNGYFSLFEIIKDQGQFKIWLVFSNKNAPDHIVNKFNQIFSLTSRSPRKNEWEWFTLFPTSKFSFNDDTTSTDVFEALDNQFNEIRTQTINIIHLMN